MSNINWYNPNRLLSYNALMSIVLSPRGNGKSFSAKEKIIKWSTILKKETSPWIAPTQMLLLI